jgi:hypothetical protein
MNIYTLKESVVILFGKRFSIPLHGAPEKQYPLKSFKRLIKELFSSFSYQHPS